MKLGGIEAGGTKMVCAIGDEQGNIFDRAVFPTETPDITVPKMIDYFRDKEILRFCGSLPGGIADSGRF